jgi:AraC-like DNA-binding protein
VVAPNVPHAFRHDPGDAILLLSFSPISKLGLYARRLVTETSWRVLSEPYVSEIRDAGLALSEERISAQQFRTRLNAVAGRVLAAHSAQTLDEYDPRIIRALRLLAERSAAVVPAGEAASAVGLSKSRFLHLFKAQLGITYRRMQIWFKLVASFPMVLDSRDLTEVALEAGFADSAHYSRCFKETFGMSPSALFRDSTFIQVG